MDEAYEKAYSEELAEEEAKLSAEYQESLIPTLKDAVSAYKKLQSIEESRARAEENRNKASQTVTQAQEHRQTVLENLRKSLEE